MKINITISDIQLNDEEHDALLDAVAAAQAALDSAAAFSAAHEIPPVATVGPAVTPESYLLEMVQRTVAGYARQAFDRSVESMSTASRTMSYADRKALVASIKSQIG